MDSTYIRNKFNILGKKVIIFVVLSLPILAFGQKNVLENDLKFSRRAFHFGINMGINTSDFKINRGDKFIYEDSISAIDAKAAMGFNLAVLLSIHLSRHWEIRTVPGIAFQDKKLDYQIFDGQPVTQNFNQILMEVPVHIKFKSDPIKDFKFYVISGMKYSYDVASNSKARNAEGIVKLNKHDIALDYGVGFEFHFPLFILSPEFRVSNSFLNAHSYDPNLRFSNVIGALKNRAFFFGINFEG